MTMLAPASKPVWPAVWKLLRLRVLLSINSFRHSKLRAKILTIVGILALVAFAGLILFLSWLVLGFLRSPELGQYVGMDTRPLLQAMPQLILTGLFFGVLFTSFGVLLQALYLSGDMDFLLASPVPMRAVFITKLTQAVLPNFGLFALFGLPILYGLGLSGGYNAVYYPAVLLIMGALTFAGAGLSALLVMAVVRLLPPRRAAEILGFVGATAGVICSQIGNLSQTFGRDGGFSPSLTGGALSLAMRLKTPWIPLNLAGQGLVDLGEGRWLSGALLVAVTLAFSGVAFWFALVTAERLYYTGWAGMQVVARKRKPARPANGLPSATGDRFAWLERFLPGPVRAIIIKDFTLLGRDLRNLSQLISPLIVGVVLSLSLIRTGGEVPAGRGEAPAWFMESFRVLMGYGNTAIALFVGWIMLGRLAGMSFSHEGKNFWMLKASPTSPRQMLIAKFLGAYLPAMGLAFLFVAGIALLQGLTLGRLLYMLVAVGFCLAGVDGILIGFGAAGANFKWDDPRRMNAGGLGCLGQIVTMAFLPLSLGLFLAPLFVGALLRFPEVFGYFAGLVLGVGGNLLCALIPLKLVEGTVRRMDEA